MNPTGELNDTNDPPNLNTGEEWSESALQDIEWGVNHGQSIKEMANLLCRTSREVIARAAEIGHHDLPLYKARRRQG